MRVAAFQGTRPEIIRLSRVVPLLDQHCDYILVHTGQNFEERRSNTSTSELYGGARKDSARRRCRKSCHQHLRRVSNSQSETWPQRLPC